MSRSDADLLAALQRFTVELGRPPLSREVDARADLPSSRTYADRWGSWNGALEAASLRVPYPRWPVHQVVCAIREHRALHGRFPTADGWRSGASAARPSTSTVRRRCGTFGWAIELAARADA